MQDFSIEAAQWGQRIEIRGRMITDQIDGPCPEQDERRSHRDNRGTDHDGSLFLLPGFPGAPDDFRAGTLDGKR